MTASRPGTRCAILLALFATAAGPLPVTEHAPDPPGRLSHHPYPRALGAVANYQSCGVSARPGQVRSFNARLRAGEARVRAKGLGGRLDLLRADYDAMLAVSTMMPCALGPAEALRQARYALHDFEYWVAHARLVNVPRDIGT